MLLVERTGPELTVADLREALESLPDGTPVRLAHQPRWAFEYRVDAAAVLPAEGEDLDVAGRVLYLVEGEQARYLPAHVAEAIGWWEG